jgi:hypothetical protein
MRHKKSSRLLFLGGLVLIFTVFFWVAAVQAQCGSQASSCKTCHETQNQHPVNNDGTAWHQSHAFGDFCYLCHAGNQQATDKIAAHQGMVPPLSDVKASCQACHPNDLNQRAEVYAKVLGVQVGSGSGTTTNQALATLATTPINSDTASTGQAVVSTSPTAQAAVCAPSDTQLSVDDPNVVNFVQHYNEVVLGERPVNLGNIALGGLIGLIALGGGGFVLFNEVRLHNTPALTERIEGEYPADVVDLLPGLTNLKSTSRKSLKNILDNPDKSDKVLGLIDAVITDDDPPKE